MSRLPFERLAIALVASSVGGTLLKATLIGLGLARAAGWITIAAALIGAVWLAARLPTDLDGSLRRYPRLAVLWLAIAIAAATATGCLATVIIDETRVERSVFPFDEFFVRHPCLSAHDESARFRGREVLSDDPRQAIALPDAVLGLVPLEERFREPAESQERLDARGPRLLVELQQREPEAENTVSAGEGVTFPASAVAV